MKSEHARMILDNNYPISFRSRFIPTIQTAFKLLDECINNVDWLKSDIAKDFYPHLRRIAVEYEFSNLVKRTKSDFIKYQLAPNVSRNYRHAEIITPNSVLTFCQVDRERAVPRDARYRSNLTLSNQLSFNFGDEFIPVSTGPFYAVLTYGPTKGPLLFASLGFPECYFAGWIDRMDLFNEHKQYVDDSMTAEETITEEQIAMFKDHVQGVVNSEGKAK